MALKDILKCHLYPIQVTPFHLKWLVWTTTHFVTLEEYPVLICLEVINYQFCLLGEESLSPD